MGFRQTKTHVPGKHSYHQLALFTGQPVGAFKDRGGLNGLLEFMAADEKFDGAELSGWDLALRRADTESGAAEYAKELLANSHGLAIVSIATHLQGQCLGDRASLKTIQFQGGDVSKAYDEWAASNEPDEDNPFFVPKHVAELSRELATKDLLASVNLADALGKLQDRIVPISSFTGTAGAWDEIFPFPPIPGTYGNGKPVGHRASLALKVILKRFKVVWDRCKALGIPFGLESHPGEIGAGDIVSTERFLNATDEAGYNGTVGLNFDASHLLWQGVHPIRFIDRFQDYIWSVHHKGVHVRSDRPADAGINGGWAGFGDDRRGWDFCFASSKRDSTNPEEILAKLNQIGFSGAITIEAEDTVFRMDEGITVAAAELRKIDLPPAGALFDEAFAAASKP